MSATVHKKVKHYHRNGICCIITQDLYDQYYGHIGVLEDHELYGKRFAKINNKPLYKILTDYFKETELETNEALRRFWWLGFLSSSPYSYDKTWDILKDIVDKFAQEEEEKKNKKYDLITTLL